jgi:hypothetical protein
MILQNTQENLQQAFENYLRIQDGAAHENAQSISGQLSSR